MKIKQNFLFIKLGISGLIFGFIILHPISMFIKNTTIENFHINFKNIFQAFSSNHLPMAFYFSIIGLFTGIMHANYIQKILKNNERINLLEKFLPICANCKKIRNEKPENEDVWVEIESYITNKTDTKFSHGLCPDCIKKLHPDFM